MLFRALHFGSRCSSPTTMQCAKESFEKRSTTSRIALESEPYFGKLKMIWTIVVLLFMDNCGPLAGQFLQVGMQVGMRIPMRFAI